MAAPLSAFKPIDLEIVPHTNGTRISYLAHPMVSKFKVEILKLGENEEAPEGYRETAIALEGGSLKVAVPIQGMADLCRREGNLDISVREIQQICEKNQISEFISGVVHFNSLPWKAAIDRFARHNSERILTYLYREMPKWKSKFNLFTKRIFIPETKGMPYAFEYRENGSIWVYFSYFYKDVEEVHHLAVNLNTDKIFQTVEYEESVAEKIQKFSPLFKEEQPGLLHFLDFMKIEKNGKIFYLGKHLIFDMSLQHAEIPADKAFSIAKKLIQGLLILEKEGIVHCGICPQSIRLRAEGEDLTEIGVYMTDFHKAYKVRGLPKKIPLPPRLSQYIPPEGVESLEKIKDPFALSIYQMGLCFKELFRYVPEGHLIKEKLVEGMTHPDPAKRLRAAEVLKILEGGPD
jgi:serine/threonine protein kinase